VVFVVGLFFVKNKSVFKNNSANGGLVYSGNEKIADLVNNDTDKDGVPDWEEGLFGTDPTKKDSNDDGIPDGIEIAKRNGQAPVDGELNLNIEEPEKLTETDQLSRELFSTVATLNQAGVVDQSTVDTISNSLINKISNSPARKTFTLSDLKVVQGDDKQTIKNYNDKLNQIYNKYPYPKYTVLDVLDKFFIDEDNVDESVLPQLDPIIKQTKNIIGEVVKVDVPKNLAFLHLDAVNELEKVLENVSDMRAYNTDIVVAMRGISQYEVNINNFESAANHLANAINQSLK